jgi:hypothetical protein
VTFFRLHKTHLWSFKFASSIIENEQSDNAVEIAKIKVCAAQSSKNFSSATYDCVELSTPCSEDGSQSVLH